MRTVGGAKWWIAAAYVLGSAVAVAGLYVGPLRSSPAPKAQSVATAAATRTPSLAPVAAASPTSSLSPGPAQTVIPSGPGDPVVYLASLGGVPDQVLAGLADYVQAKYGIEVRLLPSSLPDESAFDPVRDQYVTEDLLAGLKRTFPKAVPGDGSVVIGVLADDVHILDRTDWAWAFGMRGANGYAVISTSRMGSIQEPTDPIVLSRLRKMVLRNIGVLYYNLPLNDDPVSVLYRDVLGVDDLDRMGEDFCGSDCPVRASSGRTATSDAPASRPGSSEGPMPGA